MVRYDKATYLSLPVNSFLSVRLSDSLWESDVLLFLEFINLVFTLFYNFIEIIMLLYAFLVIFFAWCKAYLIWRILVSKFSDVLLAFTCESAIGKLWSLCLEINFFNPFPCDSFNENIPLLKAVKINFPRSLRAFALS